MKSRHIGRRLGIAAVSVLFAGAMLVGGIPSDPASAQGMTKVRAAYIPVATWLPAWIALDEGYFKKHGLDVTLMPVQNISILPGTVGRQIDIAPTTAPDLLKAAAGGLDVVAVAGQTIETSKNQVVQVMVKPDSGIKGVKDLAGKRIGTPTVGAVIHVSVLYWLKKNGVDPNSIRAVEVPFPNMEDQLKAGRVDAVESLQPFVNKMLAGGYKSIGDPVLSVGDPVLFPFWIAQGAWARANKDVIKKWIASLEDAKKYIKDNPKGARVILAKYTKLPEAIVQRIPLPEFQFTIKPEQLKVWIDVLKDLGQLNQNLDANKLVVTVQ